MSLFDSASLIVTPNGYKEDKLYSIKPTDGSGDLVVTRATTATRVNSDGLVELVPYNLLLNSLAFAANYNYNQCSITSSQVAPDGTNNAKRITNGSTATDSYFEQSISFTPNTYTWSIFVKQGTAATATIKPVHVGLGADVSLMTFIFATETITSSGSISSTGFEKLANGWYRIFCSVVIPSSVSSLRGRFGNPNVANVYNDWAFPQLVTGTSAKEYFPTTDRLDVPRLDYTNSSCPSILVEPQRTNLALRSEEFENINWVPASATITSNSAISPSGTLTADTFAGNGTNNLHLIGCSNATPVGVTTISVFAKKNTNNFIQIIGSSTTFGANVWANFDLNNGVLGSVGSSTTAKIENYGNGWYRCSITGTSSIPATVSFNVALITSATSVRAETNSLSTSVYLWGAQLEAGSNATSYVPTVASAVTRNADVISKTGISSLIGQTEGTLYAEVNINNWETSTRVLAISNGTVDNRIIILQSSSNRLRALITNAAVLQTDINTSTLTNGVYKIAIGYKANDVVFYVNGVLIGSDNSVSIPACSAVYLGKNENSDSTNFLNNRINSALIFKERLTNEQLAQLTTI